MTPHPEIIPASALPRIYPGIPARTLRAWVSNARPRVVSTKGEKRVRPGNGLGKAVVKRGALYYVDAEKFHRWFSLGETFE